MEIRNARIESTKLGIEVYGILTASLYLDYGDSGHQMFGGHRSLSGKIDIKRPRTASFCGRYLEKILTVVGVDNWEDLVGKYIRVKKDGSLSSPIIAIGNIVKEEWFNPDDLAKELGEK